MVSWPLGVPSPPCFCHRSVLTEIRAVTSDPSACCCWLIVDVKVTLLILKLHTWADWNLSISSSEPSFFIRTDSREQEVSGQKPTLPARWWGRGRGGWRLGGGGWGWIMFRHNVRRQAADFIDCLTHCGDRTVAKYRCSRTEQVELCVCTRRVGKHEALSPALRNIHINSAGHC